MPQLYALAAALFVIGAIARTSWFRGWIGEVQVNMAARLLLDRRVYRLVRNVTIPAGEGTTQIDHVIVSRFGVLVIETKNMNGLIVGKEHQSEWRQYFGKRYFTFQNPLRQNYKHTQALTELLGLSANNVFSIVVFVGGAKLDKDKPANVAETGEYIRMIKNRTDEQLSEAEVERILSVISENRLAPGLKTHRKHVEHVRDLVAAKREAVETGAVAAAEPRDSVTTDDPTCPTCGATMVPRVGKKGARAGQTFLGCSRFPACRGIREADGIKS